MTETTPIAAAEAGCGALLRQAREKAGMSLADASRQVKMRVNTLEAMENEQWAQIGAPVFIRGQLRSYGRLLKVDVEPFLSQLEPQLQAQMQPIVSDPLEESAPGTSPVRISANVLLPRVIAITVMLGVLAGLAWWWAQPSARPLPQRTASLDVPAPATNAAPPLIAAASVVAPAASTGVAQASTPADGMLSLDFAEDSWVQISAPDGKVLEQGVIPAGEHRSYKNGEVGKLVLGNAGTIRLERDAAKIDITQFIRANVARFTVSSDGSLAAVKD